MDFLRICLKYRRTRFNVVLSIYNVVDSVMMDSLGIQRKVVLFYDMEGRINKRITPYRPSQGQGLASSSSLLLFKWPLPRRKYIYRKPGKAIEQSSERTERIRDCGE